MYMYIHLFKNRHLKVHVGILYTCLYIIDVFIPRHLQGPLVLLERLHGTIQTNHSLIHLVSLPLDEFRKSPLRRGSDRCTGNNDGNNR